MKFKSSIFLLSVVSTSVLASNPVMVGDVLGRDLGMFPASAGHVGIWDGSRVLEVLNKPTVIQKNSLSSFKNATEYWGARHGIGYNHHLMVTNGWDQRNYQPQYTIGASYTVGGWKNENGRYTLVRGKFRCDTFVNYTYKSVLNRNLITWFTPNNLYNSFPSQR
ncbi:hypothetical protein L1285_23235 [Pseudoalteromonas sp. DL2-H2.2]|uniref:hypothetical protein n=1 Tax=Pseudoalteromonas sp. DL2-H2.2 TaxID=2908889 RepID=UPI001F3AA737|nr:hypothetical protein [Pseudoalteromonas sp. DL2-H2.2]MCF2911216.1 hypothetical protein [Pseudoalteromonas sp. DL2-H2.2]